MATLTPEDLDTVAPTKADTALALESSRRLATHRFGRRSRVQLQVVDEAGEPESVLVPASALRLFQRLLTEMSQGHSVTLMPTHTELTTQQAANLLNVSRPYLVKLLDDQAIPCRIVGKHRRVRFDDLMAYKRRDDAARGKVLDQLAADAQDLGMGY